MRLDLEIPRLQLSLKALLIALIAVSLSACQTQASNVDPTPKVLFVIVDGIPADIVESVPTPFIDAIAGDAGYGRAYVGGEAGGATESPTVSAVGYNSLLTGTWANKHNVYSNNIENPNYQYWDIFRIAKAHDRSLQAALFSTWEDNRTKLLGEGLQEAGGNKLNYAFDGFENDLNRFPHDEARQYIKDIDTLVSEEAARYVEATGPDLSWVYLEYSDDVGHMFGDSSELLDAVQVMDSFVGKIWQAIEQRQANFNEDWLLIVTTDHGRDSETGRSHGGQSKRERTIWIATNSDRLNDNFYSMPAIVDILPSIATHLGIQIPDDIARQLDGMSFIDMR